MLYPQKESNTLEFKQTIPKNDQIIKTIIGFCNQEGGRLILGISDDGSIIGLPEEDALKLLDTLHRAIFEACAPPVIPKIYLQNIDDKILCVIDVSEGMNKPYYRFSEGLDKGVYIRIGNTTMRATTDMIEELKWQSRGLSYDSMPVYQATLDDLDLEKVHAFLKTRKQQAPVILSNDILKYYKIITEEHAREYPTVSGILMFAKNVEHWFPEAMIICSHFMGTSGRDAISSIDCHGTLFEQFNKAYNFIITNLNKSFVIEDVKRMEKLELPEIAIREILLNAIIHRNYHIRAPIKIAIYDNRVEIFSPGSFPTPFENILLGLTDIRNMAICKIFREAQYIEKLGSGFITVFQKYKEWDLAEPNIINGENYVKCILPRKNYAVPEKFESYNEIINLFNQYDGISVSEVIEKLKIPRSTASRKLSELVNREFLTKQGHGKTTRYFKNK